MRTSFAFASLALLAHQAIAQSASHASHAKRGDEMSDSAVVGALRFPTSASPAAHASFERGVLFLHNFHYPQAVAAFQRARALDPTDAMSVAFEAFAYTHPVWNEQDTARARAALRSFAPTRDARRALARTPRERAWLDAVETLYAGDVPKATRDTAFSAKMAALHASDPRDVEAALFYALSLLGLNQGEREPVAYAHAEAITDTVLRSQPRHPGALHYKIHSVDDPSSASRGLAASRAYGEVATSAAHAQHMTSHIHIALGRWDDLVRANRRAAALSGHAFGHSTHWLEYGLIQQGRIAEARAWVDSMLAYQREALARGSSPRGMDDVAEHALVMPATWVMDTESWDSPLANVRADTAHLADVALRTLADFAIAYPAARRGDRRLADSLLAAIARRNASAGARGASVSSLGESEVMERTLRAELRASSGDRAAAVEELRRAAARWESLPFAFGPPYVIVPPRERAAELLLAMNEPADALAELARAEKMAPGRTQAMRIRARALAALGKRAEAARTAAALDSIQGRR